MISRFKVYRILDSTSSAKYWSFINEEDDEFIECLEEKEMDIEELKELFIEEDDLGQSVLFESLLELVFTSEQLAVEKFKEELKDNIKNKICNPYPKDVFKWDNQEKLNFNRGRFNRQCYEVVENTKEAILKLLESEDK